VNWRSRALLASLLFSPIVGRAEPTRNIDLAVYDPTPNTLGASFQLQTAEVGDSGAYGVGATFGYAHAPLVLDTEQNPDAVIRHQAMLTIGGAYAIANRFELGGHMPFYVQSGQPYGQTNFSYEPASGAATGDLVLHGKMKLSQSSTLNTGLALAIKLPTRTDGQFTGSDLPSVRLLGLGTYFFSPRITFQLNLGGVVRKTAEFANVRQGSGIVGGAGIQVRVVDPLTLQAEIYGELIPGGRLDEMTQPSLLVGSELLGGARYRVNRESSIGLAAGTAIAPAIGNTDLRAVVTFAYAPSAPVLPTLYKPEAPPPAPDLNKVDTDFDRIVDAKDKCHEYPEDKDGFEDDDGCPDPDNDKDGILDKSDRCPNVAEDKDGFEDGDGCPEPDNDRDGIPDDKDKCPLKPEKINGKDDNDGCPDEGDSLVISQPDRIELLENVQFTGEKLAKNSANLMGQLAATLRARADIARLRIAVHVQPSKSAEKDKALADKRAEAILIWLVNAGIATERLDVKGFGGTKPLVAPDRKGSAEINNRIELIIIDRK